MSHCIIIARPNISISDPAPMDCMGNYNELAYLSAPSRRLFSCRARVFQIKIFSGLIYSSLQSSKGGFIYYMIARADIVFLRVCAVTYTQCSLLQLTSPQLHLDLGQTSRCIILQLF
jgi:hypothetical protein